MAAASTRPWRLTTATKAAIIRAYVAGERLESIAARFGVRAGYPSYLARTRGLVMRRSAAARAQMAIAASARCGIAP